MLLPVGSFQILSGVICAQTLECPENQVDSKAEGLLPLSASLMYTLEMVDRVLSNLPGRGIRHDRVKLDWLHAGD